MQFRWAAIAVISFALLAASCSDGDAASGSAAGTAGAAASGGSDAGVGGAGAGGGDAGTAGAGGSVDPIVLSAIAANGTVGLEWPRVPGALAYRIYWSNQSITSLGSAQLLGELERGFVHRGLTNGSTYHYVVTAVTSAGESAPSNEATAVPGGEWVLEELGTGDFDDVIDGGPVATIPIQSRAHVLLLPEGYLAGDLTTFHSHGSHDANRDNDVDRWVDEVFAIEPYSVFREAFVVWYLPRASASHVGAGTTAFGVELSAGSVVATDGAAEPLWSALDAEGADAFAFPPPEAPSGEVTNHTAAFLLFDPSTGQAGFSGRARNLARPGSSQYIRAAFAKNHAHEFTHAFSNLRDEYLENDNSAPASPGETSNVATTNVCTELPWKHLLYGAGIATVDELVGAFGRAQHGYHPEFRCLMNGTHDNGEYWCEIQPPPTLNLRVDRMCNFCREMTAYRVHQRTGVLPAANGFETWKASYRDAFFTRHGFEVPTEVPQTVQCKGEPNARPIYEPCTP